MRLELILQLQFPNIHLQLLYSSRYLVCVTQAVLSVLLDGVIQILDIDAHGIF